MPYSAASVPPELEVHRLEHDHRQVSRLEQGAQPYNSRTTAQSGCCLPHSSSALDNGGKLLCFILQRWPTQLRDLHGAAGLADSSTAGMAL